MSTWKKAISVATSAALLASLLAATVAPAAFASISQTSAGNVAQGTTSAGTATFLFTENAIDALNAAALPSTQHMYVTICDSSGNADCTTGTTVTWAGTPVLAAPDSLGASVSLLGNVLDIKITGRDYRFVETISITGLKVKAASNAATGAVKAILTDTNGNLVLNAFVAATTTATGTLQAVLDATGGTAINVAVSSVCGFAVTTAVTFDPNSKATFSDVSDARMVTAVGALSGGIQSVTFGASAGTTQHAIGTTVTQTVTNCSTTTLGSPAKVVTAIAYSADGVRTVYPGETNNRASDLTATEPTGGTLVKTTTLTFTINTAGVLFSRIPSVLYGGATSTTCTALGTTFCGTEAMSLDRKVLTVTITHVSASAVPGLEVRVTDILYDVAANVPGGTFVEVGLALSGGLLSDYATNNNAVVFRGIAASAPTPTVFIGENNQATGLVTLTESAAAFFQSGTGPNNIIAVCDIGVDYHYTFAPWAKVTAGDLKLREGAVVSPDNIVEATYNSSTGCYEWAVWTASTTASTVVIGNSTFSSGPLINVDTDQAPGIVAMRVYSGDSSNTGTNYTSRGPIATVGFGVAAFRNQVAVTALAQPLIPAGAKSKGGAIQIAETANGQLKQWEALCFEIMPRTSNNQRFQDTFMQSLTTADLPVVTATGGLVVGPVEMHDGDCFSGQRGGLRPNATSGTHMVSFSFDVYQQSTAGNGKLVVDNINLITTADAPNGPVLFNVYGFGRSNTELDFQATVSNAKIGVAPKLSIGAVSALGLNPTSGYSTKTPKTQAVGKYITWKFTGGTALAGQRVNVLVATKVNGAWGGPKYLKSAWADANGIVTFSWKSSSAAAVNARVQWPGNANYAVSTSKALGGYWK